jgi:arylamine N-acetyltransferase
MNISQYLERIQIYEIEKPSYSFLSKLQLQHLLTVPFESFDSDDYLTITEGGTKRKIKVISSQDFRLKLQNYFGIHLTQQ